MMLYGLYTQCRGQVTVTELKVSDLQFGLLPIEYYPVFTPVKLERFTGRKNQGNIDTFAGSMVCFLLLNTPVSGKGSHSVIGACITQRN